ncbi:MAG TPA: serine/threonine-protein kinase [Labilithrix sp.]|jgi:serine/threonine-protein kinase|nr:serine/threonine-protein kinase [Labilithrix sp.]
MNEVRAGDVIAGKFQIERVLGEGGMGYVVAARHLQLGQTVALKFMRAEVLTAEYKSRFLREARNTVRLKSKHVSRVLDVGSLESGSPYMVMEYLEGIDLSELLQKDGPLAPADACEYLIQACEAIAEAHSHGIVHRDLKPANLFLTRGSGGERVVKVLDFGVSKVLDAEGDQDETSRGGRSVRLDSVVTKATDLLGSPSYMAPEQVVSARDADASSDVWSLGVILHRLIAGKAPFVGNSLGDLIQNIMHGSMPNLRDQVPGLPEGLEHVVLRCLQRDRARRPTAVELARLLAPYAGPNTAPSLERIAILGPALVMPKQQSTPSFSGTAPLGTLRPQTQSRPRGQSAPDKSTANVFLWTLLVVAALVGSVALGAKLYPKSGASADTPPVATPSATPAPEAPPALSASVVAPPEPSPLLPVPIAAPLAPSASAKPASHPTTKPPRPAGGGHTKPRPPSAPKPPAPPPPRSDIPSSRE